MRLSLTNSFYFVTDEKQRINDGSPNWRQEYGLNLSDEGKSMLI
jgi:hypothetical protein